MAPQINVKSYVCYSELGTIVDRHTCTSTLPVHLSKGTTADVNVDESTLCKCGWKYIIFRILPLV